MTIYQQWDVLHQRGAPIEMVDHTLDPGPELLRVSPVANSAQFLLNPYILTYLLLKTLNFVMAQYD